MKCDNCGFQANPGDQICLNCGSKLSLAAIQSVDDIARLNEKTEEPVKKKVNPLPFIILGVVAFIVLIILVVFLLFKR